MIRERDEEFVRGWRSKGSKETSMESEGTDTEISSAIDSFGDSPEVKCTSTPLKSKRKSHSEINRSPRKLQKQRRNEDTEDETSFEERIRERFSKLEKRDDRKSQSGGKKRDKEHRRRHDRRSLGSENEKNVSGSPFSNRPSGESGAAGEFKKKKKSSPGEELPITEILKRAQENARTKYEKPAALPELTTDKIYIQGRNGFNAMKIDRSRSFSRKEMEKRTTGSFDVVETSNFPPIRVAIVAQRLWKSMGLVFQGILAGMALMHFIMIQVFFEATVEFVMDYSQICEIYTNIFTFLATLCIVSIFDKFDLARFSMEHLREIYVEYNRTVLAIPLYLIVFCLHQVSSKIDDQIALMHYYDSNDTLSDNSTNLEVLLEDLNNWQKISMSKDLLAVFAWLFVSLGTRDDAFLVHLESMEKYASDVESSR